MALCWSLHEAVALLNALASYWGRLVACGEAIRLRDWGFSPNSGAYEGAEQDNRSGTLKSARLSKIGLGALLSALILCFPLFGRAATSPQKSLTTLVGETCLTQDREGPASSRLLPSDQNILCDGSVVGSLTYALISNQSGSLGDAFQLSRPYSSMVRNLECEPSKTLTSPDSSLTGLVYPCRHRRDGWPTLVVVTAQGNVLRVAEGPASAYLVLRQLAGIEAAPSSNTQQADEVRALWSTPIRIGGTSDKEKIAGFLRAARTSAGQSDFGAAEAGFRRALELQTRLYGEDDIATNDVLMDLAMSVSNQGRHDEAEALIRRAAPIVEKSPKASDRARLSGYQAYIAANKGSFEDALTLARGATALWRDIAGQEANGGRAEGALMPVGGSGAEAELAMALNLEAGMLLRTGDVTSAYASVAEAMLIIKRVNGEPPWWEADLLVTIGNVSSAQGRLSAAEAYLKKAIELRQQLFGEGVATLQARVALGRAYQAEHMRVSTIITFREAIAASKALSKGSAPFRAEDLIPFAEAIVEEAQTYDDPAKRLGLFAEAFDAFQLVSTPIFDHTMALTSARLSAETPELASLLQRLEAATQKEGEARLKLATEQSLSVQERSAEVEEAYSSEVLAQGQVIAELRKTLSNDFPTYASAIETKELTTDALRSRLGADEGMLVYLIGRTQSFVQLVTNKKIVIAPVPVGQESLTELVAQLRRGLEIQGSSVNDFDLDAAHRLYRDLFSSLADELSGLKRLVIVPSGPLANLPFGLLVTRPPEARRYETARWLVNDFDISYSPTIRSFVDLRSTRVAGRHPRKMLAFGDPVLAPPRGRASQKAAFAGIDGRCLSDDVIPPELLRSLASLPDTGQEIARVAQAVGAGKGDILLGRQATEASLRARRLADYRILYFATHGLLPGELRCQAQPGVVLTPPVEPAKSRNFDGLFDASEIAEMSIPVDLVVLSACNTAASGKANGGDSLSGLAASFFRAGSRSLLVSHWQVPSAATSALMSATFSIMAKSPEMSVDAALRAAQQRMMKEAGAAHPFFWAAFVVMGDGATKPLEVEQR